MTTIGPDFAEIKPDYEQSVDQVITFFVFEDVLAQSTKEPVLATGTHQRVSGSVVEHRGTIEVHVAVETSG